MIDFSEISENIKDFFAEKKIIAIITTVLVTLFVLALCIFVVQSFKTPTEKTQNIEEVELVPDQKLILPESDLEKNQYALSREIHEKWDEDEAKKYFTEPTQTEIEKLKNDNDKLIDEILGSAP